MMELMKAFAAGTFSPSGNIYILTTSGLSPLGRGDKVKQTYAFNADQFLITDDRKHNKSTYMARFMVDNIKKIDAGEFLSQFVYFEAVTLHLLALKESQSIEQYFRLQQPIVSVSLYERVKLLANHYAKESHRKNIKKINDLLELRNQVAHTLKPSFIKYNNTHYENDDSVFVDKIKTIMWDSMGALVQEYIEAQSDLATWIDEIDANTPEYVEVKNAMNEVVMSFGAHPNNPPKRNAASLADLIDGKVNRDGSPRDKSKEVSDE